MAAVPSLPEPPVTPGRQEVAVLLGTRMMVLVLSVLTQSLLAYTLLPAGRGAYAICVLFGEFAGVIVTLNVGRGAQYCIMTKRLSVSQGMSIVTILCLAGSALAVFASIPLIDSGLAFFRSADVDSFHVAVLLIPLSSLSFAITLQLAGLRRFGRLGLFSFLRWVVGGLAIVVLVWMLELGVNGALLALALGHLTLIGFSVADLRRHCGLALEAPSREGLRQVLRFGLKEHPARIGQAVDNRVGSLLLGVVAAGRADIGLFATGNALITKVLLIPSAVSTYLLPRVAEAGGENPDLTAFCARVTWWIVGGLLLLWIPVSTQLVPLLLSEAFAPVAQLTWIMSIGVLVYASSEVFVAYFRGVDRPQIFSYAMCAGIAVNVALFFLLHPAWGLHGAAWALTGGLLCRGLILWIMFHRATRLPFFATLLLRRTDVAYLWTSACGLICGTRMQST